MHVAVLQKEVLQYLAPRPNENFIDATLGLAGHGLAILEKTKPNGKLLGIEIDPELYKKLKREIVRWNLTRRMVLVNDSYVNLQAIVKSVRWNLTAVNGILLDLGLASWHLEESGRGFSFLRPEPLDMRYNPRNPLTAEKIINCWSERDIEKILKEYGEERFAKKISKKIIETRKIKQIKSTFQLVEIVKKTTPRWYQRKKINPATKTFQALRIAVNDELNNLKKALPQALNILTPGGRLAVISFHSLEDRIVKNFFKETAQKNLIKILTKKPIAPGREEVKINLRSRSARLRSCIKVNSYEHFRS